MTKIGLILFIPLLLIFSMSCSTSSDRQDDDWQYLSSDYKNISPNEVVGNGETILVDFYSETCHTCKATKPKIHSIKEKYQNKITFYTINLSNTLSKSWVSMFQPRATPTIILIDPYGDIKYRGNGILNENKLTEAIETIIN